MIRLQRIGCINWHLLPAQDIDVTGHVGIIGENRSGKSTLLDLLQTIMTGNSGRYLRLNASANDSGRRRGQRPVHAYCLGRLGPDQVLRKEARSYGFLVFAHDDGRPAATIGIALEARVDEASERTVAQFVAEGVALSVEDFIGRGEDGEVVCDWPLARPLLERKCAEAGTTLSVHRGQARDFVEDYLKILATDGRFLAVEQFLKAFVNAISFEQITDATDFVRRYVLERSDIRIGQLRDSIATYRGLQREIADLTRKQAALKDIRAEIERYRELLAEREDARWIAVRGRFDHAFREHRRLRAQLARAGSERDAARAARVGIREARLALEEELRAVQDALRAQSRTDRLRLLEREKRDHERERDAALATLSGLQRAIQRGLAVLSHSTLLPPVFAPVLTTLEGLRAAAGSGSLATWPRDADAVDRLLSGLKVEALREHLERERRDILKDQGVRERELTEIEQQMAAVRRRGFVIDAQVEALLEDLAAQGWKPRLVCGQLRVLDESWRDAAEALLGRDREAIIVADAHVEDAIRHLQRNRTRFRGCRIVNTRKLDPTDTWAQRGTLASVLASDEAQVMAFVLRRIGSVRLAETVEDLHRPGRAIMRDGTYDDGLTVEMRQPSGGYKIGANAGRQGSDGLRRQAETTRAAIAALETQGVQMAALVQCLNDLAPALARPEPVAALVARCTAAVEAIAATTRAMEQANTDLDPGLMERRTTLERRLEEVRRQDEELVRREERAKEAVGALSMKLAGGESEPGSATACGLAFRRYLDNRGTLDRDRARRAYREALAGAGGVPGLAAEAARSEVEELERRAADSERRIWQLYVRYHMDFGLKTELTGGSDRVLGDVAPWAAALLERIEQSDLIRYEQEAHAAAEKTESIFQHSFINELRHRLDGLERAIRDMNAVLRPHTFHYETYRFVFRPVEAYRPIIELVEAAAENDSVLLPLLTASPEADAPLARAVRTVQDLLTDESRDIAEFEDYRLYYTFDLVMRDTNTGREANLESRRGTGSGAEQQVPFYIAIGTALATAYHRQAAGDADRDKGMGLAVFDEAFSKLNPKNQKACIQFYKTLGLQIVVAAPFDKRASFYESMDTLVETFRDGDRIDIDITRIGPRARDVFAEANPANRDMEEVRRMMAGAG